MTNDSCSISTGTGSLQPFERALIFEIFGVPKKSDDPGDYGVVLSTLSHLPPLMARVWEPTWLTANFSGLVDQINGVLDKLFPEVCQLVRLSLSNYLPIRESILRVTSSPAASGPAIVDDPATVEKIRQHIANDCGISVPQGGFDQEMYRKIRVAMEQMGNGDR